jgi:hypothetical protein
MARSIIANAISVLGSYIQEKWSSGFECKTLYIHVGCVMNKAPIYRHFLTEVPFECDTHVFLNFLWTTGQ